MSMNVFACVRAWCPEGPKEGAGSPGTGRRDESELTHGCQELNPVLEEHSLFLAAEPTTYFIKCLALRFHCSATIKAPGNHFRMEAQGLRQPGPVCPGIWSLKLGYGININDLLFPFRQELCFYINKTHLSK